MKNRFFLISSLLLFFLLFLVQFSPIRVRVNEALAVAGTAVYKGGGSIWDSGGNIGIGTTAPGAKLEVAGTTSQVIAPESNLTIGSANGAGGIIFKTGNVDNGIFTSTGKLGIGTTSPGSYALALVGGDAYKETGTVFSNTSDVRLKENITPFTDGLSIIEKLNPVSYTLNGKGETTKGVSGISIIAQEVKDIIPYTIHTRKAKLNPEDEEPTDLYTFDASPLTFVAVNAIKELSQKTTTGKAALPSGQKDITINNDRVLEKSLIFLTSTSSTQNHVLYISGQSPGRFTVSLDTPISTPINFNWMISN